jgi:hypothetical protein
MSHRTHTEDDLAPALDATDVDDAAVQRFLDRLARALTTGEGHAAATMWELPALVVGDHDVRALRTIDEVEALFAGAREQYNARGVTGTRAHIMRLDWATEGIAVVKVRWPYLDSGGHEVGEETSTYVLRRDDAGRLKLRAAVYHGAVTKH